MKITFLNTISLAILITGLQSANSHAQLTPKTNTNSAVNKKMAPATAAKPAMSLEELFGVQSKNKPAVPPVNATTDDSTMDSLKELFAEPAPVPAPELAPALSTSELPDVADIPAIEDSAPTIISIDQNGTAKVITPDTETIVDTTTNVNDSAMENMAEPVEKQTDTAIPSMREMMQQPKEELPVESAVAEPAVEQKVVEPAPQKPAAAGTVTTIAPKEIKTPVKKVQKAAKTPYKAVKPGMPSLLPSQLANLQAETANNIRSIAPIDQLEITNQLSTTQLPNQQYGMNTSLVDTSSVATSTGSLNSLLDQQAAAINAQQSEDLRINVPTISAVESVELMQPQVQQPPAMMADEDPLTALSNAIKAAKQPLTSLSADMVGQNPVEQPVEDITSQTAILPSDVVEAPVPANADIAIANITPIDIIPVTEPKPLKISNEPVLYDQPDLLQTREQKQQEESRMALASVPETARLMPISTILFPAFQSQLNLSSQQNIKALAQQLKASNATVVLNGYADWTSNGSMDATNYLSERRAKMVKQALLDQGVSASQVVVTGKGLDLRGGLSKDRVDVLLVN